MTQYFDDGQRKIDLVLSYNSYGTEDIEKRKRLIDTLHNIGIDVEDTGCTKRDATLSRQNSRSELEKTSETGCLTKIKHFAIGIQDGIGNKIVNNGSLK